MIDLASVIRPGDGIIIGQACAEPQTLVEALVAQRAALSGCAVFLGVNYSGILKPEHADHLRLGAYCGIGQNRALADAGVLEIIPAPYSQLAGLIRGGQIRADIVFLQVSPPNGKGEYSLGLAADYLVPALAKCRAVVGEVNDQVPWTHSEVVLHKKDFALLAETSRPPAAPAARKSNATDLAIARNAAELVPEGATIEFGIGALPDAVCSLLSNHKSVVVHSGTVGDGIADLPGLKRADCAMLIGTRRLFEFAASNPKVQLRSSEYTHNPAALAKLDRFVAVNSAVEVDLTGQVNGEVAGGSYVGAVGGALDFVRAANQSHGGVSLMLIPSSRIVDKLSGPVSTPRSEAGVIVTEKGVADLRGCSLRERTRRLESIR
ncbi:MAG: acetyl-CoA hydrolase/transferase family protein [Clostridia bacterium]